MTFHPTLIRPLPITLPPFPGECESSYWTRLAQANHVPLARLRAPSRWLKSRLSSLETLCILSGQSRQHLARTIPDLQTENRSADPPSIPDDHVLRWACRRCVVTRTGATLPAQIWASVRDEVCTRHKLWVGQHVHSPEQQLDLSHTPDIVRAQCRYRRLRRRHGRAVIAICADATGQIWNGLAHRHYQLVRRAEILHELVRVTGPTDEPDRAGPCLFAAGFPERVALIGLFASAGWRRTLLIAPQAIAEFPRRFPLEAPLRGTSRTWISTIIETTAQQIETLLYPSTRI
jgi:hypothetical protein